MDDDFDLPDEGAEGTGGGGGSRPPSSFVSDLFGSSAKKQPAGAPVSSRSTFDDILANAPKRRQQVVSFQDEQPSGTEASGGTRSGQAQPQQPNVSSLLDSLFSTPGGGGGGGGRGRSPGTGSRALSPPRPQSRESAAPRPAQQQAPVPASNQPIASRHSSSAPSAGTDHPTPSQSQSSTHLQAELDQLRREVSALRYERSEDQRTLAELRRKLEQEQEEHGRALERQREQSRLEAQEMGRRHERDLEEARREADRSAQLLNSVQEQQGSFETMTARLDALNFGLGQIRDLVQSVGAKGDELERGWKEEQGEHWKRLDAERERWERAIRGMELEMDRLGEEYGKEIVEGRRWLEQQRELGMAERRAFQEEQGLVLDWLDRARGQLEAEKSDFLRREHDLLVRVLNERALLEEEGRQFRRQRDADVARLREEAEYLERSLVQVESAKTALNQAKTIFERKNAQLNQLRNELSRYEQLASQLARKQARPQRRAQNE